MESVRISNTQQTGAAVPRLMEFHTVPHRPGKVVCALFVFCLFCYKCCTFPLWATVINVCFHVFHALTIVTLRPSISGALSGSADCGDWGRSGSGCFSGFSSSLSTSTIAVAVVALPFFCLSPAPSRGFSLESANERTPFRAAGSLVPIVPATRRLRKNVRSSGIQSSISAPNTTIAMPQSRTIEGMVSAWPISPASSEGISTCCSNHSTGRKTRFTSEKRLPEQKEGMC